MLRLVLVSPLYPANLGACARLAANYGVRDVVLVSPRCRTDERGAELFGKGPAREFLRNMKTVKTLKQAIDDRYPVVGFTGLEHAGRKERATVAEAAVLGVEKAAAFVFGREDSGLTVSELALCTHLCTLPTSDEMTSLNLSHAVAVTLSRWFEASSGAPRRGASRGENKVGSSKELEAMFEHLREIAVLARMTTGGNPEKILKHLRPALQRAKLSSKEINLFRGMFSKLQAAWRAKG